MCLPQFLGGRNATIDRSKRTSIIRAIHSCCSHGVACYGLVVKMASDTGGLKPFSVQGRLARERERLWGMTDKERAWRRQWLKDQELSPNEPKFVPEYHTERYNPIRRAYKMPLDIAFKPLEPVLGVERTANIRWFTGKFLMIGFAIYATAYYFKYNAHDWTRKGGWRVISSRKAVVPGDAGYPRLSERSSPADYASHGFKESPI